ncbi:DUF488 domain-containing protein [Arthrobacter oryzae]|jgi:DNA-3-methyladenine glycosylase|uniref:DUF488 domain-containing protein n=1 Tax=Arthrobacter oryzae TaxID=409290 RepID=UPI0027879FEF|nr:DUF488 family protein [Arthrobacter oryzae]MDQ0076121.1 DNA-3-methyladenine glycosylase [Arthrobacter oryzae]
MDNEARQLVTKRIYEEPAGDDGFRVLVDRLWPRGVSKERARLDLWLKDIALQELAEKHQRITLLYGARDPEVNHARVLLEFLRR